MHPHAADRSVFWSATPGLLPLVAGNSQNRPGNSPCSAAAAFAGIEALVANNLASQRAALPDREPPPDRSLSLYPRRADTRCSYGDCRSKARFRARSPDGRRTAETACGRKKEYCPVRAPDKDLRAAEPGLL